MLSEFSIILLFIITIVVFLLGTFLISRLLRTDKPNNVKLSTYESGEESLGELNSTFNPKYYIIGLAFLLFEVELILLFPWAVVYKDVSIISLEGKSWYWLAFIELLIFLGLLFLGLLYIWKKGYFDWAKRTAKVDTSMPEIYATFNKRNS